MPTVDWLLDELWPDDPWAYSPEGDRCFWCDCLRPGGWPVGSNPERAPHAEDCPWLLVYKHKNSAEVAE